MFARRTEPRTNRLAQLQADLAACGRQADRLLDMRLGDQITEQEYLAKKHALVNRKAELKGKLEAFKRNRKNRFEPVIASVSEAKNATFLLAEENGGGKTGFPPKSRVEPPCGGEIVGGEVQKPVEFPRRMAFRLALRQPASARKMENVELAERGGFEPPVRLLTVQRFSKPPPSATRPPLPRWSG